jgi:FixJ family two-component response regulator
MPGGMSGPELALAAMLARPSLKVVYMSGYTDGALIQDGRIEAGAALLHKPFRRAALAQMIRSALDS